MTPETTLEKRHVLVTGAGSGIGLALTRCFRRLGARVAALDLRPPPEGEAEMVLRADITRPDQVEDAVGRAREALGPIDALVNNAAVTDLEHRQVRDLPVEVWRRVFEVNVTGGLIVTKAVLPGMLERRRGNVVFITSSLGQPRGGIPGDAVYSASKAAVEMLSYVLAQELRGSGVNVNTLYPSVKVDTGFFRHLPPEERADLAPPGLLDEPATFLVGLPPGSLGGIALSQQDWDDVPGYADALRRQAGGEEPP